MDITPNELKTMKVKQLRKIIREAILEVLAETTQKTTIDYKNPAQPDKVLDIDPSDTTTLNKLKTDSSVSGITMAGKKIKEGEIDEMARVPKGFKLANPRLDTSTFTKKISGTPLSAILDYFKENPGADVKSVQTQFNFVRPQIANGLVKGLLDAGVLVKLTASGEEVAPVAPGEEAPVQASEPEDLFMGSAENPLAMYFDKVPNDDGSEDFNDSEEPTAGELEKAEPTAGTMSDADYEAFMKYDDLKNRLDATKSNILKAKRRKGGTAGDISDKPSDEEQRLRDLKKSLETRIDAIVKDSPYLQKRIEKMTGKVYEPLEVEPEEEDTIDESFDAEYEKRKLQFYAGIIK